jgi:competence protein ComFC
LINRSISIFIPYRCPGCGRRGERLVCEECETKIARIGEPYCKRCGRPLPPGVHETDSCRECRGGLDYDFSRSVFFYKPPVDEMVKRFKFGRNFAMGGWLRDAACERARSEPDFFSCCESADGLVPVPLHPIRRVWRGFNQSGFFADGFHRVWGTPVMNCLSRLRNTLPQSRLTVKERAENVKGAFGVRRNFSLDGKKLVIVDDVMTTGATVRECSRVLKNAGALEVCVLTVARRV